MSRLGRAGTSSSVVRNILVLTALIAVACARPGSAVTVFEEEGFTLGLGLRLQPRMELEREAGADGAEWRRDFLLRRARLSASGKIQGVGYKMEWKIDGTDQVAGSSQTALGSLPSAQLENGYLQYPLSKSVEVRAGLYDIPYSRDRLTSDSQQLAVDRGAVSNVPNTLGLVDNGVGLHVIGKAAGGRAEYAVGLFDNRTIPTRLQDVPMLVGRLDLNFGSTKDIFMDAHFGEEKWYSLGVNGSFQGGIESDTSNANEGSYAAVGVDGMIDVPMGSSRFFARSEVNSISITSPVGGDAITTTTLMAGVGILMFEQRIQPMLRYDQVRRDEAVGGGTQNITYVGGTFFQRKHNLKIQTDLRFESGTTESLDGGRLQAQVNY